MEDFENPKVECHFDRSHVMKRTRYQFHLVKCKAYKKFRDSGRPVFHCRWYYFHIFFTQEKLEEHEVHCPWKAEEPESHDELGQCEDDKDQHEEEKAATSDHGCEERANGGWDSEEDEFKPGKTGDPWAGSWDLPVGESEKKNHELEEEKEITQDAQEAKEITDLIENLDFDSSDSDTENS
ncbi:unnamed protein product [Moneuplotes crassus]|uniref:CHHC U11-48K-type domain-containing protein n=1 Tax=Euplotes crassus TaxID=5936 RepID=A0AAD2CYZ4_EUPCR|nr:unnamed protein product [Moneuplotes crassus]